IATRRRGARRTLHKRFRRFLSCTPMEFLRDLRLDRVRQDLLEASPGANITEVAMRWGLTHLGRFAARYRERYGESPSATLRRGRGFVRLAPSRPLNTRS